LRSEEEIKIRDEVYANNLKQSFKLGAIMFPVLIVMGFILPVLMGYPVDIKFNFVWAGFCACVFPLVGLITCLMK
jgi:hypothetical protein